MFKPVVRCDGEMKMGVSVKCESVGVGAALCGCVGAALCGCVGAALCGCPVLKVRVCWPSTAQVPRQPMDLSVGGHP